MMLMFMLLEENSPCKYKGLYTGFSAINHSIKVLTYEKDFKKDQCNWFDPKACSYKFVVNVERQM